METNEQLFRSYIEQMQALNEFVLDYHVSHRFSGLKTSYSNEDPDVLRLLESLAFFSARTHVSALSNIRSYRNRLYQQLFPYFLTEIPDVGILRATTSGLLLEPTILERGTEFSLVTDKQSTYSFQTRSNLTLLPIRLKSVSTELTELEGIRLKLEFSSVHKLFIAPDPLSLFLDYIGDTLSSFRILGYFRRKLVSSRVSYRDTNDRDNSGSEKWHKMEAPSFGSLPLPLDQDEDLHPIELERLFFHDPRVELFLHLNLPQPESGYNSFSVEFEFSEPWPKGLVINKEIFQLHCVEVLNIKQIHARPITSEGKLSQYPILPSSEDDSFTFYKPLGVYQVNKEGMTPLISGIMGHNMCSYEVDAKAAWSQGRPISNLILHLPQSFDEPVVVHVDALWHQPSYAEDRDRPCKFLLFSRTLAGATWDWAVLPVGRGISENHEQSEILLNLLQISHKQFYSFRDIQAILDAVGCLSNDFFKDICNALQDVRYEFRSVLGSSVTAGYVIYFLTFDMTLLEDAEEYLSLFMTHLENVLNQLSTQRKVLVTLEQGTHE